MCPNLDKPPLGKALDAELNTLGSLVVETDHSCKGLVLRFIRAYINISLSYVIFKIVVLR